MKNLLFFFVGMMLLCKSIEASNWYDSVVVRADNGYVTYYDTMSPQKKSPDVIVEWCKMFCSRHKFIVCARILAFRQTSDTL